MREIRLEKVVLNMGLGKSGDSVEIAKKALGQISNKKVNDRPAKKAIRDWGIRKGEPIGAAVTVRGNDGKELLKRLLEAKGNEEYIQDERIREIKVNASLSKARDNGMKIAKDALPTSNNFISTVTSGSKGDFFNIAQITGLLGQQNLTGARIPYNLNNNTRSLPHYPMGKLSQESEYESKGFIKNSFIHGLNPYEFWFHSLTGREGITDTAMKTATSGYIQRRIIKLSEDIQIKYDGTVRNSNNNIIQFQYGDDNLDGAKTINSPSRILSQNFSISNLPSVSPFLSSEKCCSNVFPLNSSSCGS